MKNPVTYTNTMNRGTMARLNMYAKKYNVPKNKVIELALSRLFETAAKAELSATFKAARRDKGIKAFLKNIKNDAPGQVSEKKVKQKEIYYADLNPPRRGGKSALVPVVIISGDTINSRLGVSIVCPIIGKVKYAGGCVVLKKDKLNKLKSDSEIIAFQVKTISHDRLTKKIGEITDNQLAETMVWLRNILKW